MLIHFVLSTSKGHLAYILLQALFLSPKNSNTGALAVLEAAKCNIWVHPHGQQRLPLVEEILQQRPMNILDLPSTNDLLDAETTEYYPYDKTFDEAAQDPVCILHTSGTTGLPKPIVWSHALIGTSDAVRLLPPTEGDNGMLPWTSDWKEGDRIYSAFPMSHVRLSPSLMLQSFAKYFVIKGSRPFHGYNPSFALWLALYFRTPGCHT
jgi:long-subunit acyl-CoA synthetase (AMP-forming)